MRLNLILLTWFAGRLCMAESEPAFGGHAASQELLDRNPICLTAAGQAEVPFEQACDILYREDLLSLIQQGYADTLEADSEAEFTVKCDGPGRYRYVNRHGQETRIEEVERILVPGEKVVVSLYSEGRRFFGPYQSLCNVEVTPAEEAGTVEYAVTVYARPESTAIRLFARLTPVELFFRHKTRELTELVVEVCRRISAKERGEHYAVYSF